MLSQHRENSASRAHRAADTPSGRRALAAGLDAACPRLLACAHPRRDGRAVAACGLAPTGHGSVLGWQGDHPEACVASISEDSPLQCSPGGHWNHACPALPCSSYCGLVLT